MSARAELVTVNAAAEMLGVCRNTVYNLIRSGKLASVQIGRARRVTTSSIDEIVAGTRREPLAVSADDGQ